MNARPYQVQAIEALKQAGDGRHLVVMATGTGKTFTAMRYLAELDEPVLWLVHRKELVAQAQNQAPCNVECMTVQSAARRVVGRGNTLAGFNVIVTDEAHHAIAPTYQRVYNAVQPYLHIGLTATPNRGDYRGLDAVFDDIVFEYNLIDAVRDGWLARPYLRQVKTQLKLDVKTVAGDYSVGELSRAVDVEYRNELVAKLVEESEKPCLVFAVDIKHAQNIAKLIPGAEAVWGADPLREAKVSGFRRGDIPVLVNCQLFTEGFDVPEVRTVVIARPTRSPLLMAQMVGRGLRLAEGKEKCVIVDVCDNGVQIQVPTIIGLYVPPTKVVGELPPFEGDLIHEVPQLVEKALTSFECIVKSDKLIELWSRQMKIDTHGLAFIRAPSGALILAFPTTHGAYRRIVPPPSLLNIREIQQKIDRIAQEVSRMYPRQCIFWDRREARKWGNVPATEKQRNFLIQLGVKRHFPDVDLYNLTKLQATRLTTILLLKRRRLL